MHSLVSWYLDLESPRNSRVYLHERFRTGRNRASNQNIYTFCRMVHTDKYQVISEVEVRLPETMLLRFFHAGQRWVLD
jgi:hypothetical protein